jgi:DNA-binding NtrC family response regulator
MAHFNTELKKSFAGFTPAAAELMKEYPWPGNIRELRNVVERTMILCKESEIDAADLPEELRDYKADPQPDEPLSVYDLSPTGDQFPTLSELEDRYIRDVLNATGQNKTHAVDSRHSSYFPQAPPEEAPGSQLTPPRFRQSVTGSLN